MISEISDKKIQRKIGFYKNQFSFMKDKASHDRRYAIDTSKIENEQGWKADENFERGILKKIEWYLNK